MYGGRSGVVDLDTDADVSLVGEVPADFAGEVVAGLGDVDGDHVPDLIVGAPGTDRAYVVSGTTTGTAPLGLAAAELLVADGFLMAVAGPGDVDGDGLADVVVTEPRAAGGLVHLILGAPSGLVTLGAGDDATLTGADPDDQAGIGVADEVDLDGDGYDDLVVAANGSDEGGTDSGAVFVIQGPVSGVVSLADADAVLAADAGDEISRVVPPGDVDVDVDGVQDLLVAGYGATVPVAEAGTAWLAVGPFSGTIALGSEAVRFDGEETGHLDGYGLAGPGDVDRDGHADLAVGAPSYDGGAAEAGVVYLLFGGAIP